MRSRRLILFWIQDLTWLTIAEHSRIWQLSWHVLCVVDYFNIESYYASWNIWSSFKLCLIHGFYFLIHRQLPKRVSVRLTVRPTPWKNVIPFEHLYADCSFAFPLKVHADCAGKAGCNAKLVMVEKSSASGMNTDLFSGWCNKYRSLLSYKILSYVQ